MKVKATRLGYYNHRRQKPGAVFSLNSEKHFSDKWMEKVEGKSSSKRSKKSEPKVEEEAPKELSSDDEVI